MNGRTTRCQSRCSCRNPNPAVGDTGARTDRRSQIPDGMEIRAGALVVRSITHTTGDHERTLTGDFPSRYRVLDLGSARENRAPPQIGRR